MSKKYKLKSIDEAPEGVKNLTPEAQKQWLEICNSLLKAGDDYGFACERAWQSVKECWEQTEDGDWKQKQLGEAMPYSGYSLEDATYELKDVEIFATGLNNGIVYTEKDLEEIIENFGKVDAPLKIGHDPKQKIAGQPAVGWIKNIYKKGKKLYADITGIPKTVYTLIEKGAYKKRSIELFDNFIDNSGKMFNNVLAGLALLGAEIPALQSLEDVVKLYGYEEDKKMKVATFENEQKAEEIINEDKPADEVVIADNKPVDAPVEAPAEVPSEEPTSAIKSAEEIAAEETAKAEAEAKKSEDEAVKEELEAIKKENALLKADAEKLVKEKEEKEINEFMRSIEKKITPAVAPMVFELIKGSKTEVKKFSIGGKEVEKTEREVVKEIFMGLQDMDILKTYSKIDTTITDPQDKADAIARNFMKEDTKLTYKDAINKTYELHPELVVKAKNIEN